MGARLSLTEMKTAQHGTWTPVARIFQMFTRITVKDRTQPNSTLSEQWIRSSNDFFKERKSLSCVWGSFFFFLRGWRKEETIEHTLRWAAFQTSQLLLWKSRAKTERVKVQKVNGRAGFETCFVHLEIKKSRGQGKNRVNDPHGSQWVILERWLLLWEEYRGWELENQPLTWKGPWAETFPWFILFYYKSFT